MTEDEFWNRPLKPGAVKVDASADATRARVVREAFACAAARLATVDPAAEVEIIALRNLSVSNHDAMLCHLGRLMK